MASQYPEDWNYGNAIHTVYLILERIYVDAGQMSEAREDLYKSVTFMAESPAGLVPLTKPAFQASPQMDSFGPDMSFARDLLGRGEKDTVIKYLDLCAKFWKGDSGDLALW